MLWDMLYKLIQWWGDEARFYACFYDSFGKRLSVPSLLAYRYWNGRLQKYKKKNSAFSQPCYIRMQL